MITCCASGVSPQHEYGWIRPDREMSPRAIGVNSSTLFIPDVGVDDMGLYACLVTEQGSVNQSESVRIFIAGDPYGKS